MQFPRLVYKNAEVFLLVRDDAGFNKALLDGWFKTVPEALQAAQIEKRSPLPALSIERAILNTEEAAISTKKSVMSTEKAVRNIDKKIKSPWGTAVAATLDEKI